ncbi:MAG: hypothetical protein IDH49_06840 [Gammaproteobacteria bacterium]|nr:hypothetical protein [Gammaproteobacteria bacterium]
MGNIVKSGAWISSGALDVARSHPSVAVHDGKIYTFGGGGMNFASMNLARMYDPATGRWEKRADMPTLRSGAVAATVGDRIYVMGGGFKQANGTFRFLTAVEIYDPLRDVWETGPDLLQPHDYPAVAFLDGHIYVMGGHHPDATQGGPQTDPGFDFCERLDIAKGAWEEIAPLPTPRFALSAVVMGGKIMTMGGVAFSSKGFNNFDFVETYDPATGKWTRDALTLPWTAAGQGSCVLDGQLFIFGGYSGDGIHDRAAYYDAEQGAWYQVGPMPGTLAAMGVAVVDKSAYLIGGWADAQRIPVGAFYVYSRA